MRAHLDDAHTSFGTSAQQGAQVRSQSRWTDARGVGFAHPPRPPFPPQSLPMKTSPGSVHRDIMMSGAVGAPVAMRAGPSNKSPAEPTAPTESHKATPSKHGGAEEDTTKPLSKKPSAGKAKAKPAGAGASCAPLRQRCPIITSAQARHLPRPRSHRQCQSHLRTSSCSVRRAAGFDCRQSS